MAVKTVLLWDSTGKNVIGSVRLETNKYDTDSQVLVPYEHEKGQTDFMVIDVMRVVNAVGMQLLKKRQAQEKGDNKPVIEPGNKLAARDTGYGDESD